VKEHPLKALIASHLLGGNTGLSLAQGMADRDVESMVGVAMRIASEIETQVAESIAESECLIVAHLLGGKNGLSLSTAMTDQDIETMVGVAVRVLNEMDKQAKQVEVTR
jgi:uncharacterized protein (DUF1501 family)